MGSALFAAQSYIDLFRETDDATYLQSAYDIALDNVNYLIGDQQTLNTAYIAPVKSAPVPKGTAKDKAKQIKDYNKNLKVARKTELPPVSEPLLLNCDLLFALADQLDISENEQRKWIRFYIRTIKWRF